MLNAALQYLCSKIGAPWVVTGTLDFAGQLRASMQQPCRHACDAVQATTALQISALQTGHSHACRLHPCRQQSCKQLHNKCIADVLVAA